MLSSFHKVTRARRRRNDGNGIFSTVKKKTEYPTVFCFRHLGDVKPRENLEMGDRVGMSFPVDQLAVRFGEVRGGVRGRWGVVGWVARGWPDAVLVRYQCFGLSCAVSYIWPTTSSSMIYYSPLQCNHADYTSAYLLGVITILIHMYSAWYSNLRRTA